MSAHPLQETFSQLNAVSSYMRVSFAPVEPHQFTLTQWIDEPSGVFERLYDHIRAKRGCDDKLYLGMAMLDTTWLTAMSSVACLYFAQRFPDLSADNVFYSVKNDSYLSEIGLHTPHFYALTSDSDAHHPDCIGTFPTFEALRDHAQAQLVAYVAPLIEFIQQKTTLGKRAMWSGVADRCAQMIITSYQLLGKSDDCADEIANFLGNSPLKGKTGVLWVEHDDHQHPFLERGACCLSYKLEGYEYCRTCPLLSREERYAKVREVVG